MSDVFINGVQQGGTATSTPGVDPTAQNPELARDQVLDWLNWSTPQKTKWGGTSDKFGHGDYWAALMNVRDEDKTSSQEALKTQRQRVLDWLITDEGKSTLAPTNVPGYKNPDTGEYAGLYEHIKSDNWSNITEVFGDHSTAPDRHKWFGHADLSHALAAGKSRADILSWIEGKGATNILRDGNVPGREGGVYEWLLDDSTTTTTPDNTGNVSTATQTSQEQAESDPNSYWGGVYNTGGYVDPGSNAPNVTRNTSNYPTLDGDVITRPDRRSLKIRPGDTMIPKGAMSLKAPKRKKYEQTTDLARQARNSLNIS